MESLRLCFLSMEVNPWQETPSLLVGRAGVGKR